MKYSGMKTAAGLCLLVLALGAKGQEVEDFLACGEIVDRVERVICLEEALDAATPVDEKTITPQEIPGPENAGDPAPEPGTDVARESEGGSEDDPYSEPVTGYVADDGREAADGVQTVEEAGIIEPVPVEDRVQEFGRGRTAVVANEDGEDELYDEVVELEMARPNMWLMRLASGQVWHQTHARRYNLREGDEVRIYPTRWGDDYRLSTERLSGFIQVRRVD